MTRQTSIAAYHKLSTGGPGGASLLSETRWQVYDYLYRNGPLTAYQVDDGLTGPNGAVRPTYHKRLSELRSIGLVAEVGEGICPISRHRAILWDVTNAAPDLEPGRVVLQPPGEATRARGRAHVKRLLDAERVALTLFLAELRSAILLLDELDPPSAAKLHVTSARIFESHRRWVAEDGKFPVPILVDLEVCPACSEVEAFGGHCGNCGWIAPLKSRAGS